MCYFLYGVTQYCNALLLEVAFPNTVCNWKVPLGTLAYSYHWIWFGVKCLICKIFSFIINNCCHYAIKPSLVYICIIYTLFHLAVCVAHLNICMWLKHKSKSHWFSAKTWLCSTLSVRHDSASNKLHKEPLSQRAKSIKGLRKGENIKEERTEWSIRERAGSPCSQQRKRSRQWGMERFLTKTAAHFQGNRDWTVKQWLSTDWHSQKQACVDKLHYMLYGRSFNPQ